MKTNVKLLFQRIYFVSPTNGHDLEYSKNSVRKHFYKKKLVFATSFKKWDDGQKFFWPYKSTNLGILFFKVIKFDLPYSYKI